MTYQLSVQSFRNAPCMHLSASFMTLTLYMKFVFLVNIQVSYQTGISNMTRKIRVAYKKIMNVLAYMF